MSTTAEPVMPFLRMIKGPREKDLTGSKFHRRLVIGPAPRDSHKRIRWHVQCDCGNRFITLTQGLTRSGSIGCRQCSFKGPRLSRRKRPFEATYNIFKGRTPHKVEITYEQFLEFTKINECHYCGAGIIWLEYRKAKKGGTGSNLDRKCSKGSYSMENVVVCCGRCNYGKNRWFSYDEWVHIGAVIRTWDKPKYNCSNVRHP